MASGPVENEIKIRVADEAAVKARIQALGYTISKPRIFEANTVYDRGGEVRASGQLLRLRLASETAILTLKGRATPGPHKSRPETEIVVSDFAACNSILNQLGYEQSFRYEKYRTEFRAAGEPGVVTFDETPIGNFLELEGPAEWIDRTAHGLGFEEKDYLTESYGSLYYAYCREQNIAPTNMVFAGSDL
jgi:adenylate cyclase class 2